MCTWSDVIFNKNFIDFLKYVNIKIKAVEISNLLSQSKMDEEAFTVNKSTLLGVRYRWVAEESHKYRKNQDGLSYLI